EILGPRGRDREHWMSVLRKRLDLPLELGVGRVYVGQVGEHAVIAVDGGLAEWLVGDRKYAGTMLAGGLGDELLEPQPEAGQCLGDDERELVAPGLREAAERRSQPHRRRQLARARVRTSRARTGVLREPCLPGGRGSLQEGERRVP